MEEYRAVEPPAIAAPAYQLLLLGKADARASAITNALTLRLSDLGLDPATVSFLEDTAAVNRDRRLPAFAIFFGHQDFATDSPLVADLLTDSIVIAPVVSAVSRVSTELPPQLLHLNAIEHSAAATDRVVSLALETFRLLRAERRLFISYRRQDSQPFANKLYDALDARGFDVFLDTRSVPPAADFQSQLWHRMSDSDVVVLVDTPGFRASRWTTAELARANATNIQILHLLWPGQSEDSASALSHFMKLHPSHFGNQQILQGESVTEAALAQIYSAVERLRARAIAARHRYLVDNFCDAARDVGLQPAIRSERWIEVPRHGSQALAVVPAVGVPTSDRLNAIVNMFENAPANLGELWVVYDNRGLLLTWLNHLEWLNAHLPVRAVQMSNVPVLLGSLSP